MRIGITGWRGFIGSHLRERIENPVLFQGDMRDLNQVKRFVKQCDRIYHIAGKNRDNEGDILFNNVLSTGNLVLACKLQKVSPEIILLSSTQTEWNPDSEYGLTKLIEEKIVEQAEKWCIFRLPNVYGPRCKPFYNSVVATFCFQIAHGKEVMMKNPSDTREFISVDKLIECLLQPEFNEYVMPTGDVMDIRTLHDFLTVRFGEHEDLEKTLTWYKENMDAFVSAS